MNEIEQIKQPTAASSASDPEPVFDTERVIWDVSYRQDVIENLRHWRLRQDGRAVAIGPIRKAA